MKNLKSLILYVVIILVGGLLVILLSKNQNLQNQKSLKNTHTLGEVLQVSVADIVEVDVGNSITLNCEW